MNIGTEIKAFRKAHSISQKGLCDILGIKQSALSLIENGTKPSQDTMETMVKAGIIPDSGMEEKTIDLKIKMLNYEDRQLIIEFIDRLIM